MAAVSIMEMTMVRNVLRPMPVDMSAMMGMFQRPCRSGTICNTRSR